MCSRLPLLHLTLRQRHPQQVRSTTMACTTITISSTQGLEVGLLAALVFLMLQTLSRPGSSSSSLNRTRTRTTPGFIIPRFTTTTTITLRAITRSSRGQQGAAAVHLCLERWRAAGLLRLGVAAARQRLHAVEPQQQQPMVTPLPHITVERQVVAAALCVAVAAVLGHTAAPHPLPLV